jgi:glyoxylase-like metal-dependent hydrolase (beta-lactamase superfamily II)
METLTIGNVEIRPILDAAPLMDPRYFFPEHADQMIAEYPDLIVDPRQLMQLSITSFLVRSAGKTILIDSGLGNRRRPRFPRGNLDVRLQEAGVSPGDVDFVVHTHLHVDHVGWNTVENDRGEPEIFFPRARFEIQQAEWDFWMQPDKVNAEGNEHLKDCVEPLRHSGRIDFFHGEAAFDENLSFVATPGHTPGHVGIGVYSAGERAIIIGDASHHPAQIDHPDWSPQPDIDPVQSASTRSRLFDEAEADGRTWIAGHWPFPGIGRIVRLDGKRVFQAL